MPETRLQKRLRERKDSLSNTLPQHNPPLEKSECKITKKRKSTAKHDNKSTDSHVKGSPRQGKRNTEESSMNQDSTLAILHVSQLMHLPTDILHNVTAYCSPSELCLIRGTSKAFKSLIETLPLWKQICTSLHLGKPGKYNPTYFTLANSQVWRICDLCLGKTKGRGSDSALMVKDINNGKIGRLCCKCRRAYYVQTPEPTPVPWNGIEGSTIDPDGRITKSTAKSHYKLSEDHLASIGVQIARNPYYRGAAPMQLYLEIEVVTIARNVHGGDIGIAEAREATRARGIQIRNTKQRCLQQRQESMQRLLTENGLEHYKDSNTCHSFLKGYYKSSDEFITELQTRERESQAQNARKTLVQNMLQSHGMPNLIGEWTIMQFIRYNLGDIDQTVQGLVSRELENQRIKTVKNALIIRLKKLNYQLPNHLWDYDHYIKDPSNDIDAILKTIIYKEEQKIARQARKALLLEKLSQHSLRHKITIQSCEHYIKTGIPHVDSLMLDIIHEDNKEKRRENLTIRLLHHDISASKSPKFETYVNSGVPELDLVVNELIEEEKRRQLLKAKLIENGLRIPPGDIECQDYIDGISGNDIDTIMQHVASIPYEAELQQKRKPLVLKLLEYGLPADCIDLDICSEAMEDATGDLEDTCIIIKETNWYMQHTNFPYGMKTRPHNVTNDEASLEISNSAIEYYQRIGLNKSSRLLNSWIGLRFSRGVYRSVENDVDNAARPPKSLWPLINSKWLSKLTKVAFRMLMDSSTVKNIGEWQSLLDTDYRAAEEIAIHILDQSRGRPTSDIQHLQFSTQGPNLLRADAAVSSTSISALAPTSYHSSTSLSSDHSLNTETNGSSSSNISELATSQVMQEDMNKFSNVIRLALGVDWLRQVLEF